MSRKHNETNIRKTLRDSEPQPYLTTKDLKLYYFGSKTYERNEKPKTLKTCTPGRNPKKVRGTGKERTKEAPSKKSRETSGSVEDVETDMLVASVQRWSDFYDSLWCIYAPSTAVIRKYITLYYIVFIELYIWLLMCSMHEVYFFFIYFLVNNYVDVHCIYVLQTCSVL